MKSIACLAFILFVGIALTITFSGRHTGIPSTLPLIQSEILGIMKSDFGYVLTKHAAGSCVLFTRIDSKGNVRHFAWTCAHVILVVDETTELTPQDALNLIVTVNINGSRYPARVIAIGSDATGGTDVALLELPNCTATTGSVVFDGSRPEVGSPVFNYGAAWGRFSPPSYFVGCISAASVRLEGSTFDQMECPAAPGSSGSGIFNQNGKCEGLMVALMSSSVSLEVPSRCLIQWARKNHLEWAVDPSFPFPKGNVPL